MEFALEMGGFALRVLFIVVGVGFLLVLIAGLLRKGKASEPLGSVQVVDMNKHYRQLNQAVQATVLDKKTRKSKRKKLRKQRPDPQRPNLFVIEFKGDLMASSVGDLSQQVNALIPVTADRDEVVVLIESAGGRAHAYGLAAAQLDRFKRRGVKLTVCVDLVAASGGYMMACVADKILASPFAVLGSIGVVAMVPNLHRLLQKLNIDYDEYTAGEFKRTVSLLAENTDEGKAKFQQDLQDFHQLFKSFVSQHRSNLDMDQVATGEIWYGEKAREVGLVDELVTSDEYLLEKSLECNIFLVQFERPKTIKKKLSHALTRALEHRVFFG